MARGQRQDSLDEHRERFTALEERVLLARAKAGDQQARDAVVLANLGLAKSIAWRYRLVPGMTLDDLRQAAYCGLLQAIDHFDESRGTRFSTCATWYIRMEIMEAIFTGASLIYVPRDVLRARNRILRGLPLHPQIETQKQIGERIDAANLAMRCAAKGWAGITHPLPIEETWSDSAAEWEGDPLEVVPDRTDEEDDTDTEAVDNLVRRLPESLAKIVRMRFGLGHENMTLQEIADSQGVTRQCIQQKEVRGLKRLKEIYLEQAG